jgi:uridine kinase
MKYRRIMNNIKEIIKKFSNSYPKSKVEDYIKILYQDCFGPGHMFTNSSLFQNMLFSELEVCENIRTIEPLIDNYFRYYISKTDYISIDTLTKMFEYSCNIKNQSEELMDKYLKILEELIIENEIDLDNESLKFINNYKKNGYRAISHSDQYRSLYQPHYRVIHNSLQPLISLIEQIELYLQKQEKVIIAIDGKCGSGKTTVATILERIYSSNLFHMDDFFLTDDLRTEERLSLPGGNVDYERFKNEILLNLKNSKSINYNKYSCSLKAFSNQSIINDKNIIIIEGSYSLHPELIEFYDIKVFIDINYNMQKERILKRNGIKSLEMFINKWIPLEEKYFEFYNIKELCNIKIEQV